MRVLEARPAQQLSAELGLAAHPRPPPQRATLHCVHHGAVASATDPLPGGALVLCWWGHAAAPRPGCPGPAPPRPRVSGSRIDELAYAPLDAVRRSLESAEVDALAADEAGRTLLHQAVDHNSPEKWMLLLR